jgi:hypothetical protein
MARTSGGDLYAAKDGQIYKNTGDGWHSYNNGSWNSVNKPTQQSIQSRAGANPAARPEMQSLNQEWQNRQRGAMQTQNFENFRRSGGSSSGRTRGGGGYRGGGRRR